MVEKDYGIKHKIITMNYPQANYILERVHQTLENHVRAIEVHKNAHLEPQYLWSGVLAATDFAFRSAHHTTLQDMPG